MLGHQQAQCSIHRQVVLRLNPNSLIWQHNWKWLTRYPMAHEHISVIDTLTAPVITVTKKCITLLTQISLTFLHPWLLLICQIVLKFWTEHSKIIAVLLAKFQNNLTNTHAMITARVWFEITMLIDVSIYILICFHWGCLSCELFTNSFVRIIDQKWITYNQTYVP